MARAPERTKLPLDRWAQIIGVNPLHFNGGYVNVAGICDKPWLQSPFQTADRVSRDDLAHAILMAESRMETYLGFRLLPDWEVDEWSATVQPTRPELINLTNTDIRGFAQTVKAEWGYFRSGGIKSTSLIEADASIAYSDPDGDGYNELATVSVTVDAGTDPSQIRAFYPASNAIVENAAENQWEIRPIRVSVSGTTATILFRREQAVLPELQVDLVPPTDDSHMRGVDLDNDANLLTVVDVYRVYNDPQTQVSFLWEPFGNGCACDTGCVQCAYSTQTGCLMLRKDRRNSILAYRPATWDADSESFNEASMSVDRQPDIVRLYYFAGFRDERMTYPALQMDPELEYAVAYFAASLLDRAICECGSVGELVKRWQRDLAVEGEERLRIDPSDLGNPFGTRAGAVYAWKVVRQRAIGRAAG